jgi:hypothetical protein
LRDLQLSRCRSALGVNLDQHYAAVQHDLISVSAAFQLRGRSLFARSHISVYTPLDITSALNAALSVMRAVAAGDSVYVGSVDQDEPVTGAGIGSRRGQ